MVATLNTKGKHKAKLKRGRGQAKQVPTVVVESKGSRMSLDNDQMLDIAYSDRFSLRALGEIHEVSKPTLHRCALLLATAFLYFQLFRLDSILASCLEHAPEIAIEHMSWDETGERLTMILSGGGTASQQTSVRQVMVCRILLVWGSLATGIHRMYIVVPPIQLPTVSAECLYNALFFNTFTRGIHQRLQKILATATTFKTILYETDAASGNDKLFHLLLCHDPFNLYRDLKFCHSHQEHIIESAVIVVVGLSILNTLYRLSSVLRAGGYFLRLHQASYPVIKQMITPRYVSVVGNPPSEARLYAAEVCHYLLTNAGLIHENSKTVLEAARTID